MGGGGHNDLRRAAFILHENIDDVAEVSVERARAHGRAEFQRALEGHDVHLEPVGGEGSVFLRGVEQQRIRSGQRAYVQRVCGKGAAPEEEEGKKKSENTVSEHECSPEKVVTRARNGPLRHSDTPARRIRRAR